MSLGEKYEALTEELLKAKESSPVTKPWEITYFCRFLYETYTPPKIITEAQRKKLQEQALREQQQQFATFNDLLNELRKKTKFPPQKEEPTRNSGSRIQQPDKH